MIFGLPAHPLLVHLAVALTPVAAVLAVLSAVWPAARRRLGWLTPAVTFLALVAVGITSSAGEWLAAHVPTSDRIQRHTSMGEGLVAWAFLLFALTLAAWYWYRTWAPGGRRAASTSGAVARAVPAVFAVLVVAVAIATLVDLALIGHSGAAAVWNGVVTTP
mgnify:CR=1 FL=1